MTGVRISPASSRGLTANVLGIVLAGGEGKRLWPLTADRAKRIKANRPKARIAVGKLDGPTFKAKGSVVKDPALYDQMYRTFATKYPDGWPKYEQQFRKGLADGTRVLIKYQPVS